MNGGEQTSAVIKMLAQVTSEGEEIPHLPNQ